MTKINLLFIWHYFCTFVFLLACATSPFLGGKSQLLNVSSYNLILRISKGYPMLASSNDIIAIFHIFLFSGVFQGTASLTQGINGKVLLT